MVTVDYSFSALLEHQLKVEFASFYNNINTSYTDLFKARDEMQDLFDLADEAKRG